MIQIQDAGVRNVSETPEQKRERIHQQNLERLRRLRPIDDTMMRALFQENLPLVQFVLRIITGKKDLVILSCTTQADMKRVTGARSLCLDAYATDDSGKKYDLEIQRADKGADPHRARYHSSVLDVENLDEGQKFIELPDTYTIFITEKDFFGRGAPVYWIRSINETTGEPFDDGAYILYVNGEYQDDSELGKLMQDFNCTTAEEMNYPLMADRTRYLKETSKGVSTMCKIMEEAMDERARETAMEIAQNLLEKGIMSHEEIAEVTKLPLATIKELAGEKTA